MEHIGTNNADMEVTMYSDSREMQEPTEEGEKREGWTYNLIRNIISVWKQKTRVIQEDGKHRTSAAVV